MNMKIAVVGGGAAGMTASSRIKALKPDWDVKVFEATSYVSHAPCGIPYVVEGAVKQEDLMYYRPEFFRSKRGINLHINAEVVEASDGYLRIREKGIEKEYEWDKLLIATGSSPRQLEVDGSNLKNILTAHLPPDAEVLSKLSKNVKNVVIIGAGYIGIEMAEAFVAQNKSVTVIEINEHPLPRLDEEAGKLIAEKMSEKVNLRLKEKVLAFEGEDEVRKVVTDKDEYRAELVLVAVGVKPNIEIAEQLGCKIERAIWTDSRMRTSVENVYAAGDCCETLNLITKKRTWIPLAPSANKMGYVAGVNIAGGDLEFPGVIGTQITKFFDFEIGSTGLTEKEAKKEGFEVKSAFIKARTKAHYYPGGKDIWLKVVADRETGRLLGAQVLGSDVLARINTFAVMISSRFTTKDAFFSDLAYAPPFSPVWEPVILSARVLKF